MTDTRERPFVRVPSYFRKRWRLLATFLLIDVWAGAAGHKGLQCYNGAQEALRILNEVPVQSPVSQIIEGNVQELAWRCERFEVSSAALFAAVLMCVWTYRKAFNPLPWQTRHPRTLLSRLMTGKTGS
jgi:hypothetical protein